MERFNWQDVISVNIFTLRIVGLWPKDYQVYTLDLYALYSTISVIFFMTINVLFQTINVIFVYTNLKALTLTILIGVAELLALLKIYSFIKNIGTLKQLMVALQIDIFQPKNLRQILLVQPAIKTWKTIYTYLLGGVMLVFITWLIFPFINGSAARYELPFPVWYPYDIKSSLVYKFTYLHQTVSMSFLSLADYNIDMLIAALMMYIGAQCDILCDNLRNLGVNADFETMLKQCITHHVQILRFAENSNNFFDFIILGQFFASSVCLGIVLFQMALLESATFEFYTILCCVFPLVLQIFAYCWFGDEVQAKSNQIAYAAFESVWRQECLRVKRSLIIFVRRALTPIRLSTFKLFYLSLDTFVKILRSAVSYYTVLRQFSGSK